MINYKKRLKAYIIDILLLFFIINLVNLFIKIDNSILDDITLLNNNLKGSMVTFSEYFHKYAELIKKMDLANISKTIINSIIIFAYFLVIPMINKGSTFGQHITNIKVVDEMGLDVTLIGLIRKNLIINGLAYTILTLMMLILPPLYYFIGISLLGLIQITVVIISAFMVIYRRDKKGLQDIFSYTMVVEK